MRFWLFIACLIVGAGPAVAKECRMPDVPSGLRVELPTECRAPIHPREAEAVKPEYTRSDRGFIDLNNGTKVRISGRGRVEMGFRP